MANEQRICLTSVADEESCEYVKVKTRGLKTNKVRWKAYCKHPCFSRGKLIGKTRPYYTNYAPEWCPLLKNHNKNKRTSFWQRICSRLFK